MLLKKTNVLPPLLKSPYLHFLMIMIAASLTLTGCGDDTTGPEIDDENGDEVPELVQITGQSFTPTNLEVEIGTTVRWDNNSSETHTVTSGSNREHDDEFNSGDLPPGESYSYTFTETGTFDYYCIPHPGMEATVTVIEGD